MGSAAVMGQKWHYCASYYSLQLRQASVAMHRALAMKRRWLDSGKVCSKTVGWILLISSSKECLVEVKYPLLNLIL
jgi:hypothetical protein